MNFDINVLTSYQEQRFTASQITAYGLPIKQLIKAKQMELYIPEHRDNASMLKFILKPTTTEAKLDQCFNALDTLYSIYPKASIMREVDAISITIPKNEEDRQLLTLKNILASEEYRTFLRDEQNNGLYFTLGETVDNEVIIRDLRKCVHLLVAGQTGSGKSVCLHSIITSLMYRYCPDYVKFVMFDMKGVELTFYEESPYLLEPICIEDKNAYKVLDNLVNEMNKRYAQIRAYGTRTIENYNALLETDKMPYIVVVIDEYADLILTNKEVDDLIKRLSQKARACGIHLIISTQRPSADVVTGIIKANIPTKIALTVGDITNSRIILDENGAERLNQNGDMIYKNANEKIRLQGTFISEKEITDVNEEINKQLGVNSFFEKTAVKEKAKREDIAYVRKLSEGDMSDEKTVLSDEVMFSATYAIDKNKASRIMIKKLLHCGDRKANDTIDKLKRFEVIGEYQEDRLCHPILINSDDFFKKFVSESEVNCR